MKNKKGFTLVELLVVIALIGVIMLLVVPNVINTFNKARKNTFITQTQSMIKKVKEEYTKGLASGNISLNSNVIYCDSQTSVEARITCTQLDVNSKFRYAFIIDSIGIYFGSFTDGNYCYSNLDHPGDADDDYSLDMVIDENRVVKGGTFDCSSGPCVCSGMEGGGSSLPTTQYEDGEYYWHSGEANSTSLPSNYSLEADLSSNPLFVKTTVLGGAVTKHEACAKYNSKTLCLGNSYYTKNTNANLMKVMLKSEITNNLGVSSANVSCVSGIAESATAGAASYVNCSFGDFSITASDDSTIDFTYSGSCIPSIESSRLVIDNSKAKFYPGPAKLC